MRTSNRRGVYGAVGHRSSGPRLRRRRFEQAVAQTPFVPYFGKNRIRYDDFKWQIYTTDHFEIYYYPEIEQHLERIAQLRRKRVPAGQRRPEARPRLQGPDHPLQDAERVPAAEHRAGRAARRRPRLRRAVSRPHGAADRRAVRRALSPDHARADAHLRVRHHPAVAAPPRPAAVGRRGAGRLHDRLLESVRPDVGARRRDRRHRPADERLPGQAFVDGRLPYNLGHAAFEFIESRWGKEGLRQFLFALRKSVIGGGESAYEEAFRLKPEEFDEQFDKYLKDRFKPFRDKERPADYGRDLAPKRGKTPYTVGRLDRAVPLRRPDGGRGRQPQGPGARHRPDVDEGRQGHPQPDRRVQQGPRLRVHRDAGRLPRQRRAVDVVGAGRRSHRLLRAHGEAQDAHPAERRHQEDREAHRAEDRRHAGVAGHQPRRP